MSRRVNPQRGCKDREDGPSQTTLSGNHRASVVEIIDDDGDEVKEVVVDPYNFSLSTNDDNERLIVRRPKTRRRRKEFQSNWDDDEDKGGVLQDEDSMLKEVLRQSRLDAKRDEERRAMSGDVDALMKLTQLNTSSTNGQQAVKSKEDTAEEEMELKPVSSQDTPTNSQKFATEAECSRRCQSPLLFPSSQELQLQDQEPEPIETGDDISNSPTVPVSITSPAQPMQEVNTKKEKKEDDVELSSEHFSSTRFGATGGRSKLKLTRRKSGNTSNDIKNPGESETTRVGLKRKWRSDHSPVATPVKKTGQSLAKKIQLKVFDFAETVYKIVSTTGPSQGTATANEQRIVLDEEEEEDLPSGERQIKHTPGKLHLARHYHKSQLTTHLPATLTEALKAQLFFAPPGVDVKQYAGAILKLFERYKKRLRTAQSLLLDRIDWGPPVMPGPRKGDSLDAARSNDLTAENTRDVANGVSVGVNQTETVLSERSRSLRSAHASLKSPSTPASTSKRAPSTVNDRSVVDDSEDLAVLVSKPSGRRGSTQSWKQRVAKASEAVDFSNFGEDVVIPPVRKAVQPWKRKDMDIEELNPEIKQSAPAAQENLSFTKSPKSDGASPLKRRKLEETLTRECDGVEKIPIEADVTMKFPEMDSQTGKLKLASKRSRKLSSDSDKTDDERDGISCEKSTSMLEDESKPSFNESSKDESQEVESSKDESQEVESSKGESQEVESSKDESQEVGEKPSDLAGKQSVSSGPGKSATNPLQCREHEQNVESRDEQSRSTKNSLLKTRIHEIRSPLTSKCRSDQDTSPAKVNIKKERSEASLKAAAAAEKRRLRSSPVASTSGTSRLEVEEDGDEPNMQCPMCFHRFSQKDIESHASDCNGVPPDQERLPSPSSSQTDSAQVTIRKSPPQTTSNSSPTKIYRTLTGESRELKDLRVVLERSPVAQKKGRRPYPAKAAVRNLSFTHTEAKGTQGPSSARGPATSDGSEQEGLFDQSEDSRGLVSSQRFKSERF